MLATLYIDTSRLLVLKARTTTRENGTNEVELFYGKFPETGLPEKIIFSFQYTGFQIPKGSLLTMMTARQRKRQPTPENIQSGKIEITYLNYSINRGLADSLFK